MKRRNDENKGAEKCLKDHGNENEGVEKCLKEQGGADEGEGSRRKEHGNKKYKKKIIILAVIVIFAIPFCYWQNNHLSETYYTVSGSETDAVPDGLKIAHISDLHNKSFGKDSGRLLEKIKAYNPDFIAVTGDVVDANHTDIETAVTFMKGAAEIAPVYYITGNHEVWLDEDVRNDLLNQMREAGVICLDNECISVEYKGVCFNIIGLDDSSLGGSTLNLIMREVDTQRFTLLLAHEPQYFDSYSSYDVDLVLSGHAHGGQFRLPFIGGVVAPDQGLNPEYYEGEHIKDGTTMIISRGLGNSVIPLRLFNFPEIVFVEVKQ